MRRTLHHNSKDAFKLIMDLGHRLRRVVFLDVHFSRILDALKHRIRDFLDLTLAGIRLWNMQHLLMNRPKMRPTILVIMNADPWVSFSVYPYAMPWYPRKITERQRELWP